MTTSFDALVHAIYDAALLPEGWPAVWETVTAWIGADSFHFFSWDPRAAAPLLSHASTHLSSTSLDAYADYYGAIDPRRQLVERLPVGELFICHQNFDARYVSRSEYYQDYLLPWDLRYVLGGSLRRSAECDVYFAWMRGQSRGQFTDEECLNANRIVPHLVRAVALEFQSNTLQDVQRISTYALDQMEVGVIALDAQGRACYCNAVADAFLRAQRGIKVIQGIVRAMNVADDQRMQAARLRVVERGESICFSIFGPTAELTPKITVTVARLPSEHPVARLHQSAKVLMLVNDASRRRVLTTKQSVQMFGLTEAEARLARALTQGGTMEQYALENHRSIATVRAHMRSIFVKTGTGRQSELVRLLVAVPAVRD